MNHVNKRAVSAVTSPFVEEKDFVMNMMARHQYNCITKYTHYSLAIIHVKKYKDIKNRSLLRREMMIVKKRLYQILRTSTKKRALAVCNAKRIAYVVSLAPKIIRFAFIHTTRWCLSLSANKRLSLLCSRKA